jgi:sec-independent protein translocase protein TatA
MPLSRGSRAAATGPERWTGGRDVGRDSPGGLDQTASSLFDTIEIVDIGPPELILILVVVLVLFGGAQLPKLAKNLGKAQREFKSALQQGEEEPPPAETAPTPQDDSTKQAH